MPSLFGIECSADVFDANRHLVAQPKQPKRTAAKVWTSERHFMAAVFEAIKWDALHSPEFAQLFHIPNENSHKQPGVRGGIPDLFLPVARGGKNGLFIELKVSSGKLSGVQQDAIRDLRLNGYEVAVIWDSVEQVCQRIADYLAS